VYRHPRYQRVIRMSKKLKAHDEANESRVGDRVVIEETRPLSKEKRWRIRSIVNRANPAARLTTEAAPAR
jgi:small subunit ribosomal protein S17